jgi:RNA polymerase sigma factor (sigma-70 family)
VVLDAKAGTQAGWQALLDFCRPLVMHYARGSGLRASDIEDIAQEVYAELAKHIRAFRHDRPGAFRAWLRTIVKSKLADHFRARSQQPNVEPDAADWLGEIPSPLDSKEAHPEEGSTGQARRLRGAIRAVRAKVNARTWETFSRVVFGGENVGDVARELNASTNAVHSACRRVRRLLHEALESG